MFVKKKRLKARDIIAWEKPLLGERLKRPGNRVQTAQIRVSFGVPERGLPGFAAQRLYRTAQGLNPGSDGR